MSEDATLRDDTTIVPPDDGKTLEWLAALCAAGLDYSLDRDARGWLIHVDPAHAAAAQAELAAYERDNLGWPPPERTVTERRAPSSWAAVWVAGFLVAFHAWTGPSKAAGAAFHAGALDPDLVRQGEWWRTITALTLHADANHLAGNLLALPLFGHALSRRLGGGIAWTLILLSGVLGNAAAVAFLSPRYASVGASTASFGALGLLAMRAAVLRGRRLGRWGGVWSPVWLPIGAGLALLSLLGTGPRSDVGAHLTGFAAGLLLAALTAALPLDRAPRTLQPLLQLLCLLSILAAWAAAAPP